MFEFQTRPEADDTNFEHQGNSLESPPGSAMCTLASGAQAQSVQSVGSKRKQVHRAEFSLCDVPDAADLPCSLADKTALAICCDDDSFDIQNFLHFLNAFGMASCFHSACCCLS